MSTATAAIVDSLPESGYSRKMTAAEEQQLLERIRAGDDSGFEQLVREHTGAPIFHLWEHGMGDGVLGGVLVSHAEQGRRAGLIARADANAAAVHAFVDATPISGPAWV